jgi:hypothetical protein
MLLVLVPMGVSAQAASAPEQDTAKASPPGPLYRSAFEGFNRHADEPKLMPWRDANDQVARIGGWRAYAQEAQAAQKPRSNEADVQRNEVPSGDRPAPAATGSPHTAEGASQAHHGGGKR